MNTYATYLKVTLLKVLNMSKQLKYYTPDRIEKKNAIYNVVFGERSNGKTFALLKRCLADYLKTGNQMAYVRRWKEDIRGRRASQLYAGINELGVVGELTDGNFTGVHYYAGKWYLCNYDEKTNKPIYSDSNVIAYAFALSDVEHDKSTSFPRVCTIVFDEFLTPYTYLPDEFVLFMNVVSTIVRQRDDVKVFMLGNTVSRHSPYFAEMGLDNILTMPQGTIDVYRYGTSPLTVAVEYCSSVKTNKKSNQYFAFNNPKLEMITGGAWELSIYPHLPLDCKYKPKDVLFTYFIEFSGDMFQCEVVDLAGVYFTYIHIKTTPLKNPDSDLIYSLEHNPRFNYNRNLFQPLNKTQEMILWFFQTDRVFYQNNQIGDSIRNFIKNCKRSGY